jgi:hypothetical protein
MRTIVDIPEAELAPLNALCRSLNISRAEGVRRAIHGFVAQSCSREAEDSAFGLWAKGGRQRG